MPIKILDLSRVLAGPLCTMTLGDLGADIIKVERPAAGDETRSWGPPFDDEGMSAYFRAVNRNKLSIALDLSVPVDRVILEKLVVDADVVIDNFLPGALNKLGLHPRAFLETNPDLVWCTLSGFGPGSDRPGYDFVIQAESGWMAVTGEVDGEPMKVGIALADVIAGKDAAIAILAALEKRRNRAMTIEERWLNISLLDSARAALVNVAQNVLVSGLDAKRWGNAHPNLVPYQLFEASDAPFVIAVGSDAQWRACAESLGLDELARDSSLSTNAGRVEQRKRIVDAIAARVSTNSAGHWLAGLQRVGVPSGLVRSVKQALEGSHASAVYGVASPVGGEMRFPPPRLDEHGAAIRSLGWRAFQR